MNPIIPYMLFKPNEEHLMISPKTFNINRVN